MTRADVLTAVLALSNLPGVRPGADAVRDACTKLRWHEALRRRIPQAATESRVRGAAATARLEGAKLPTERFRDTMRGAEPWPDSPDPLDLVARSAARVTAETEHVVSLVRTAPMQALARLHVVAMADVVPADQLGRPRTATEVAEEFVGLGPAPSPAEVADRLDSMSELIRLEEAPAPVVAGLIHAELATLRPFVRGNGLVARAMERAYIQASGLDPTGVAVPEEGYVAAGPTYIGALTAYGMHGANGVSVFLQAAFRAQVAGADEGVRIADAVLRGRLS